MREAFRVYLINRNMDIVRSWGSKTAEKMGLETFDGIEKVAG